MSAIPVYDARVAAATEHIYEKVQDSTPRFEWELQAPLIDEINRLKQEKNAVILGHNYQVPAIFHGISDYTGAAGPSLFDFEIGLINFLESVFTQEFSSTFYFLF